MVDRSAIVLEANLYAAGLLNFSGPKRLLKHSLFRLFDPDSCLWLADQLSLLAYGEAVSAHHKLGVKQNEGFLSVECVMTRLPVTYGLDGHYLLILRDLRAEDELDQYHHLIQTLLDNSESLIYAFDENERCILANKKNSTALWL
ncbi:MAG: hypothetical protein LRY63_07000 [Nitrincola sp.]|nr:hypothetical protein [Nitrincola sp.]